MPIEIRELLIRVTVSDDGGQGQSGAGASAGASGSAREGVNGTDPNAAMVQLLVEKVLEMIKEKTER